ncbi:RNA polymerase sigma factor [Streptomyces sp. NPDC056704]|uniref:RNA polymerase sigma factor n=1 Tax=Streptomyces sp. NPDC056704 TaxID=3345917 RepID=UPI00369EBDEE
MPVGKNIAVAPPAVADGATALPKQVAVRAEQAAVDDPLAVAGLLEELREVGAEKQVALLAERAAVEVSVDDPLAVASLLEKLREVGAEEQVALLAERIEQDREPDPADVRAQLQQAAKEFQQQSRRLRLYVRGKVGNNAVADDVLSAVAEKYMLRARKGPIDSPGAYLHVIAKNCVQDYYRSAARRAEVLTGESDGLEWYLDQESSAEDTVAAFTEHRELWLKIKSLPKQAQMVIWLSYVDNLSTSQTAVALGMSDGAVREAKRRALRRLRALYLQAEAHATGVES